MCRPIGNFHRSISSSMITMIIMMIIIVVQSTNEIKMDQNYRVRSGKHGNDEDANQLLWLKSNNGNNGLKLNDLSSNAVEQQEQGQENYQNQRFLQNAPTANPRTKNKIRKPSIAPTPSPSQSPSEMPSQIPSEEPTNNPTHDPSLAPSFAPTVVPTLVPTKTPSATPSLAPTATASAFPSALPTKTRLPTNNPSVLPSNRPTRKPSMTPSTHPTSKPTMQPSITPSAAPSHLPSLYPSSTPSLLPSISPTVQKPSIQDIAFANDLILSFEGSSIHPLNDTVATDLWESITSEFVTKYLSTIDGIMKVDARALLGGQEPPYHGHHTRDADMRARALEESEEQPSLVLTFDVWAEYRTNDESFMKTIIRELIVDAFETAASRANYIELLQRMLSENFGVYSDDSLTFAVYSPEVISKGIQENADDDGDGLPISETAVIAIGCAVLVVFVLALGYYYSKPRRHIGSEIELVDDGSEGDCSSLIMSKIVTSTPPADRVMVVDNTQSAPLNATREPAPVFSFEQNVEVIQGFGGEEIKDDATDHDTMNLVGPPSMNRDVDLNFNPSTTFTVDTDFRNDSVEIFPTEVSHDESSSGIISNYSSTNIFGAQSTIVTKAHTSSDAIEKLNSVIKKSGETDHKQTIAGPALSLNTTKDENISYTEKLIEVIAPAGLLGVVIDSSRLGPPVIHAIKSSSVLTGKLMVGDRIVYFDNIDTTELSSMQLTKLIGCKSEYDSRHFGVIRRVFNDDDSDSTPASWDDFSPSTQQI